jgi:hypothetical protein
MGLRQARMAKSGSAFYQYDENQLDMEISYPNQKPNNRGWKEVGEGTNSSVSLGENLFVTIIMAKPYSEGRL